MAKNTKKTEVKKTKEVAPPRFPAGLMAPVANFLKNRISELEKRRKEISKEDPFKDVQRATDNAAPDIEADEQFGHARTSAMKSLISKRIVQLRKALSRVNIGKYGICEECGQMIDTDRLIAFPEATLCAKDARKRER